MGDFVSRYGGGHTDRSFRKLSEACRTFSNMTQARDRNCMIFVQVETGSVGRLSLLKTISRYQCSRANPAASQKRPTENYGREEAKVSHALDALLGGKLLSSYAD